MRHLLSTLGRALLPCPLCGASDHGNRLCPECLEKLHFFKTPRCPGCGGELDGALALCSACLDAPTRPWQGAAAIFEFRDAGRELVHQLKFGSRPELARPLGILLAEAVKTEGFPVDAVAAVPLHWRRYWRRGYNQSALVAEITAKTLHLPLLPALRRIQGGAHQSTLSGLARQSSVRHAFVCSRPEMVKGRTILLIDDVLTTGFTLAAAAKTLKMAGCAAVFVAAIARTPRYFG